MTQRPTEPGPRRHVLFAASFSLSFFLFPLLRSFIPISTFHPRPSPPSNSLNRSKGTKVRRKRRRERKHITGRSSTLESSIRDVPFNRDLRRTFQLSSIQSVELPFCKAWSREATAASIIHHVRIQRPSRPQLLPIPRGFERDPLAL